MIVRVHIQGDRVLIENEDKSLSMTASVTAAIRGRMLGRETAFFVATVECGGGKDRDGVEYMNPSAIVELGEVAPERSW